MKTKAFTDMMLIKTHSLSLSYKLMIFSHSVTVYSYWFHYLKDDVTKLFLRTKMDAGEGRRKKTLNKQTFEPVSAISLTVSKNVIIFPIKNVFMLLHQFGLFVRTPLFLLILMILGME